eukprot:4006579-Prymnesium_polylepis.2
MRCAPRDPCDARCRDTDDSTLLLILEMAGWETVRRPGGHKTGMIQTRPPTQTGLLPTLATRTRVSTGACGFEYSCSRLTAVWRTG